MAKSTNKGIGYSSKAVQDMFTLEMKSFDVYFPNKDAEGLPIVTHAGLYTIWRDAIVVNNLVKSILITRSIADSSKDGVSLTKMFKRFSEYGLYSDFPVFLDTCMREWPSLRGVLKVHWNDLGTVAYPPIGKFAFLFDHVLTWYDGYVTTKKATAAKVESKKAEMISFNLPKKNVSAISPDTVVNMIPTEGKDTSTLQINETNVQSTDTIDGVGYTYLNGKKHNKYGALNRTYEEDLADAIISGDTFQKALTEGALIKFSKNIEESRRRVADLVKIKETP